MTSMGSLMVTGDREWWDAMAASEYGARLACWPEDASWQRGIDACLAQVASDVPGIARWHHPRLLDLGCGIGRLTFPVAAMAAEHGTRTEVIGLDLSPVMIGHAERRRREEGWGSLMFVIGNGRQLPTALAPLALIWSVLLFQHLPGPAVREYIHECARLLEAGGQLRLQFVAGRPESFPASFQHPEDDVIHWCKEVGLAVPLVERGVVQPDWTWLTCVRTAFRT